MASESQEPERELAADAAASDERTEALVRERDEHFANWQRAQADYQNLRRRMSSDIDSAVQRAKKPLHQDLLLVLDVLLRRVRLLRR